MNDLPSSKTDPFEERLAQAEKRMAAPQTKSRRGMFSKGEDSSLALAFRIASELLAGILVGVGAGYGLDRWTGYKPLFLIIFSLLGVCAGILNVWRVVNTPTYNVGMKKDGRSQRGQRIED